MKQTKKELLAKYNSKVFQDKFVDLFSLSILFRKAILKEDYEISNKFEEYIVLNKCGKELKEKLRYEKFKMLDDNTIHFSIFLMFYNEELLIDVEKTNTEQIKKILNDQIISGDVLFPWIYGRLLYDKYFDEFEGEDESLCNSEVLRLLKNTPKGVQKKITGKLLES